MQKEIKVGEKTFIVREVLAVETDDIDFDNKKEALKKQVMISTGISEEDYNKLTLKERFSILRVYNELNIPDFQ